MEHYARFLVTLITTLTKQFLAKVVFCYLLYIKEQIVRGSGQASEVVSGFMRSTEVDWQTVMQAAIALKD